MSDLYVSGAETMMSTFHIIRSHAESLTFRKHFRASRQTIPNSIQQFICERRGREREEKVHRNPENQARKLQQAV